jgi:hypothetical protein
MFINVASSMAVELGLDKPIPTSNFSLHDNIDPTGLFEGENFSKAAKRAYMGCYYLSSAYVLWTFPGFRYFVNWSKSISLGFQKPNNFEYNELIEEYGFSFSIEPETVDDYTLLPLIKAQKLEEKIRDFFKADRRGLGTSPVHMEAQLQAFEAELEEWRLHTSNDVKSMVNIGLGDCFLQISIYSYNLSINRSTATGADRYLNPQNLAKCMDACRRFFEYLLTISVVHYRMFTHVQWGAIVQTIVICSRLSFPLPSCPSWDASAARQRTPLPMYLESLCYRCQSLTRVPASHVGLAKDPDGPYIFKMTLESILKEFKEKLEVSERLSQSSETDTPPRRVESLKCPIRDPELAALFRQNDFTQAISQSNTPDSGYSTSGSIPVYFDLWRTMTSSWGDECDTFGEA